MSDYLKPCGCDDDEWCDVCRPPKKCPGCKEKDAEIERLQLIIYERGEIYEHHRSCDLLNAEIERLRTERDTFEIELRRVRNGGRG